MNQYRHSFITDAPMARLRKDIAAEYLRMRLINPAIARMVFVRTRALEKSLKDDLEHQLYHEGTVSQGGLALLIGDK
jgi:hypothetical protein